MPRLDKSVMKRKPLSSDDLTASLEDLPGWSIDDGKLHRVFEFEEDHVRNAALSALETTK